MPFRAVFLALLLCRSLKLTDGGSLPLYENVLTINATTPLTSSYENCIGWPDYVFSPSNFSWYGMRVQLPDDASIGSGFYWTDLTNPDPADGAVLPYNTTLPTTLVNRTFQTEEENPTIRITMNDELFWESYQFTFSDGDSSSSNLQEQKKVFDVMCTLSENENGTMWKGTFAVEATLTISLSQNLIRNGSLTSGGSSIHELEAARYANILSAAALLGAYIFAR